MLRRYKHDPDLLSSSPFMILRHSQWNFIMVGDRSFTSCQQYSDFHRFITKRLGINGSAGHSDRGMHALKQRNEPRGAKKKPNWQNRHIFGTSYEQLGLFVYLGSYSTLRSTTYPKNPVEILEHGPTASLIHLSNLIVTRRERRMIGQSCYIIRTS